MAGAGLRDEIALALQAIGKKNADGRAFSSQAKVNI